MLSVVQLLIVAGPSGSGKSTFIETLAAGRLPPPIARCLPAGADAWPTFTLLNYPDWLPDLCVAPAGTNRPGGAIIHIDTATSYFEPRLYAGALPELGTASAITVVELHSDPDQLALRFANREWGKRDASAADPDKARGMLLSHLVLPKTGLAADQGAIVDLAKRSGLSPAVARKLAFYRQQGWQEVLHQLWRQQLGAHWPGKRVTLVEVKLTDVRRTGDEGVWQLKASSPRTF